METRWLLHQVNQQIMTTYHAPWGKTLKIVSALLVVLAIASLAGAPYLPDRISGTTLYLGRWLVPVVVMGCLPFMVLGYEITDDAILVKRPLWRTRLNRSGLTTADVVPRAMSKCLRTCGNGGIFSFTGWYWSKSLGSFTAYVTDNDRTVVLRFGKKTVVVSPERPEEFVKDLSV